MDAVVLQEKHKVGWAQAEEEVFHVYKHREQDPSCEIAAVGHQRHRQHKETLQRCAGFRCVSQASLAA
jgi:hypothetical protein